jgi:hypothetical protein
MALDSAGLGFDVKKLPITNPQKKHYTGNFLNKPYMKLPDIQITSRVRKQASTMNN